MEIRAYDEAYLASARNILGHAADFAIMTLNLDPDDFGKALMVSEASKQFAAGNPRYVAGMNGCELARQVLSETGTSYNDAEDVMYIDKSPEYWAGWALAHYQWQSSRSFMDILSAVAFSRIIEMYPVFHEMDVTQFTDHMNGIMRKSYPVSRLKVQRINNSMSPEDLAEASGIELRDILLLEEKEKDINSIAAINLLRLSRALHCGMEDLIEL
ncbi:helix-turn-helix domain-containing protein [Succinimonas sp.]|uniref:helix-turn-helix domain-containing protein n=1 Tax=Succinimonas sp. TaxID=1936151 RepID=UPI00386F0B01